MQQPFANLLREEEERLVLTEEVEKSSEMVKNVLADAVPLIGHNPKPSLSIVVDASDVAIIPVVRQCINDLWGPSSFFFNEFNRRSRFTLSSVEK